MCYNALWSHATQGVDMLPPICWKRDLYHKHLFLNQNNQPIFAIADMALYITAYMTNRNFQLCLKTSLQ